MYYWVRLLTLRKPHVTLRIPPQTPKGFQSYPDDTNKYSMIPESLY